MEKKDNLRQGTPNSGNDMSDFGESQSSESGSIGERIGISDGGCCLDGGEESGMSGGEVAGM